MPALRSAAADRVCSGGPGLQRRTGSAGDLHFIHDRAPQCAPRCPSGRREDAEAPKAKLVNPNSLSSSRSGSSRSGTSSTQSMVHGAPLPPPQPQPQPRSQRPCVPAVAALREGKGGPQPQPPAYPQHATHHHTLPPSHAYAPGHAAARTPEPRPAVPALTPPPSSSSSSGAASAPHPHPHPHPKPGGPNPKLSPANLARMGATPVMIPAQTKAFQTV
ncbi:unnamed protein product [Merluccius merluccius]